MRRLPERPLALLSSRRSHAPLHSAGLLVRTLVLVTLTACSALPTRDLTLSHEEALGFVRHRAAPPVATGFSAAYATPAQRRETLSNVWAVIGANYYDPTYGGVDIAAEEARAADELATARSDEDFYRILADSVGALHDSHTQVLTAEDAESEHTQRAELIGITYTIVEGHVVLVDVRAGSAAAEAGIGSGLLVDAIDDVALDEAFLVRAGQTPMVDEPADSVATAEQRTFLRQISAVSALLTTGDDAPHRHRLVLRRPDDSRLEVEVAARSQELPTTVDFSLLPGDIAWLRFNRFDPSIEGRLASAVEALGATRRGLIIDLRDNPGGAIGVFTRLMDHLVDRETPLGTLTWRFWFGRWTTTFTAEPAAARFAGPVAVLVSGGTGSAAEWMAHALFEERGAIVVGEATCGCVVGLREEFVLPDGGTLHVAQAGGRSPHGRRMESDPLQPTLHVTATLADLRAGRDVVVEAAARALLAQ